MTVKLLSDSMDATITDGDHIRIDKILSFWFKEQALTAPQIDGRMDTWFGDDQLFDQVIASEFVDDVEDASEGRLDHWAHEPNGLLALILLLDQFRRNIHRNWSSSKINTSMFRLLIAVSSNHAPNPPNPVIRVRRRII